MAGKRYIIFVLVALLATVSSCMREVFSEGSGEIILNVDGSGLDLVFETKTTALATLPASLYWGATQGSPTESMKWESRSKSVTDSKIYTGEFQSVIPGTFTYYVSNLPLYVGENTSVIATNTTDVICGRSVSTTSRSPSVVMNHIYSRTGTLTLTLPSGYAASAVTWEIKAKGSNTGTAGTYNLKTDAWGSTSGAEDFVTITSLSDLYLIPGEYMVQISFTATKGDFSRSYVEEGTITMVAGKICNITAVSATNEGPVTINVTLTPWDLDDLVDIDVTL